MKRRTLTLIVLVGLALYVAGVAAQEILLDENIKAGKLMCFRDFSDPKKYYYLADQPHVALRVDNNMPEFAFIKYVKNVPREGEGGIEEGEGGGVVTCLMSYEVSDEDRREAERVLQQMVPGAKLAGPVIYRAGSYAVTTPLASGEGEDDEAMKFIHQIFATGKAPVLEGHKCAVSMRLTKEGATLLWESFKMGTSQVSVVYEMEVKGYRNPFEATIIADWSKITKHHQLQAGIKAKWFGADIDMLWQELRQQGAVQIIQKGEDENMEKILAEAQRIIMARIFDREEMPSLGDLASQAGGQNAYSNLDRAVSYMRDEEARRRSRPSGTREGSTTTSELYINWPGPESDYARDTSRWVVVAGEPSGAAEDTSGASDQLDAQEQRDFDRHVQEGNEHWRAGRYQQAADAYEEAWLIDPRLGVDYNIAQCHAALGDYGHALTEFQQLETLETDAGRQFRQRYPQLFLDVAECLLAGNRAREAATRIETFMQRAREADLPNEEHHMTRARQLAQQCRDAGVEVNEGGSGESDHTPDTAAASTGGGGTGGGETGGGETGGGGTGGGGTGGGSDLRESPLLGGAGSAESRRSSLRRPGEQSPAAERRDALRSPYGDEAGGDGAASGGASERAEGGGREREQERTSGISMLVSYKMRNIKVSGRQEITLKKYTLDTQPFVFTANINGMRRYMDNPAVFKAVNLDDPVFKQREVLVSLDGQDAADFDKFINYVTVQLRKKHQNGDITYDEIKINKDNFQQSANYFRMVYGWKGDNDRTKWLSFDYKVVWSFFGGAVYEQPWTTTDEFMINVSPPTKYRTIRFEADPQMLRDENVRHVDATIRYTLFGTPWAERVTLKSSDEAPEKEVEYVHMDGDYDYEYELSWRLRGNKKVETGPLAGDDTIIYCDELPEN